MRCIPLALLVIIALHCKNTVKNNPKPPTNQKNDATIPKYKDAAQVKNIPLPEGYTRQSYEDKEFGYYLQQIPLKQNKTVYLYNGSPKQNQTAQYAVLDISVGKKDLQQCADAVMRLRAEYLFSQKRFAEIVFWDNELTMYQFTTPYTKEHFNNYLQKVFGMCGSASLAMQLKPKNDLNSIAIGDVFIKGGFPGHAVIVVDVAKNSNGETIFMLAQSYMPAQDIHILNNPSNATISPWYAVSEIGDYLFTPEYTFTNKQLMTW